MVELLLGPISTTSFFPGVIKAVNQLRLLDRTTGYRVLSSSYRVFTVNPPPKKKNVQRYPWWRSGEPRARDIWTNVWRAGLALTVSACSPLALFLVWLSRV